MMKKYLCMALLAVSPFVMGDEKVEGTAVLKDDGQDALLQQADDFFESDMELVKESYRKRFAEVLMMADKVEVFLVDFDGLVAVSESEDLSGFLGGDEVDKDVLKGVAIKQGENGEIRVVEVKLKRDEAILVPGYEDSYTKVLAKKEVSDADRVKLLGSLAKQVAVREQAGGALCHYPIHGLKVYRRGKLLYETTFCWKCSNFGFSYPNGDRQWLSTNDELRAIFHRLMPIPQSEVERFEKKYPEEKE